MATNVVRTIKIKNANGTTGPAMPIGVNAVNILYNNGKDGQQVLATVADITDLAVEFNQQTQYSKGDYVIYNRLLYRLTAAHASGVAWGSTAAQQVRLADELKTLQALVDNLPDSGGGTAVLQNELAPTFQEGSVYEVGDYVYYEGAFYRFTQRHAANTPWSGSAVRTTYLTVELGRDIKQVYSDVNNIVKISETQPTQTINKLWVNNQSNNEIPIPTYGEFTSLQNKVCRISFNVNTHEMILSAIS